MRILCEDDVRWAGRIACRWHLTVRDQAALDVLLAEHAAVSGMGLFERSAVLLHGIASARPFTFGNKRTAWVAAATFLDLNGVELPDVLDAERAAQLVVGAAENRLDRQQVAIRLRELFEGEETE